MVKLTRGVAELVVLCSVLVGCGTPGARLASGPQHQNVAIYPFSLLLEGIHPDFITDYRMADYPVSMAIARHLQAMGYKITGDFYVTEAINRIGAPISIAAESPSAGLQFHVPETLRQYLARTYGAEFILLPLISLERASTRQQCGAEARLRTLAEDPMKIRLCLRTLVFGPDGAVSASSQVLAIRLPSFVPTDPFGPEIAEKFLSALDPIELFAALRTSIATLTPKF